MCIRDRYIQQHHPDFICLNYANTDMVGHTGVFNAAVKATETVDSCLSRLIPLCLEQDYAIVIIADHGNSDMMINPDGSPNCLLYTSDAADERSSVDLGGR